MTLTASRNRSRLFAAIVMCIALTASLVGAEQGVEQSASRAPEAPTASQSELHEVQISVDVATGKFSYSLNPVFARRGDRVQWTSDQGAWSVTFQQVTPFELKVTRGAPGGLKQLVVKPDAAYGSYKYTVGLAVGNAVFTDDPEIIIGP